MERINMMKFFRKHKKAVSPVIAVMLLVAVAVAAVGAYFIWFRSFQSGQQEAVREATADVIGPQLQVDVANDASQFYVTVRNRSTEVVRIETIKAGEEDLVNYNTAADDIASNSSKTFTYDTNDSYARGDPLVFTVGYNVGNSKGTIVHTYSAVIATTG